LAKPETIIMRFKKFILIPLLFFLYVFVLADILASINPVEFYSTIWITSGGLQPVGVGDAVGIMVTRGYLFGLMRLPVYTSFLGDISGIHNAFFLSLGALTAVLIAMEYSNFKNPRPKKSAVSGIWNPPILHDDIAIAKRRSRRVDTSQGANDTYESIRDRIRSMPGSYSRIKASLGSRREEKVIIGDRTKIKNKEVYQMPEKKSGFGAGFDFRKLLKALAVSFGIGILHYFIAVMASPEEAIVDGGVSWALILLLMYLEYKL
jgi:hypothetical protein